MGIILEKIKEIRLAMAEADYYAFVEDDNYEIYQDKANYMFELIEKFEQDYPQYKDIFRSDKPAEDMTFTELITLAFKNLYEDIMFSIKYKLGFWKGM